MGRSTLSALPWSTVAGSEKVLGDRPERTIVRVEGRRIDVPQKYAPVKVAELMQTEEPLATA
jgi:hypothetical protein